MLFKCNNLECTYEVQIHQVSYSLQNGRYKPNFDDTCPLCKGIVELTVEPLKTDDIHISQAKFGGMSNEDKRTMIKKRSKSHFEKFDKSEVEEKRNNIVKQMKQKFEGGEL